MARRRPGDTGNNIYPSMLAGLLRASPHFGESPWEWKRDPSRLGYSESRPWAGLLDRDKDITTVIKETDDATPNSRTTTIKRAPKEENPFKRMSPNQNAMIGMLNQAVAEMDEPKGQVLNDTRELGPLVEQGRPDYAGMDASTDPTTDPRWTNGTQNQPATTNYPTGNPWDQHGTMTESGVSPPNYGAQQQQMMSEIDAMMGQMPNEGMNYGTPDMYGVGETGGPGSTYGPTYGERPELPYEARAREAAEKNIPWNPLGNETNIGIGSNDPNLSVPWQDGPAGVDVGMGASPEVHGTQQPTPYYGGQDPRSGMYGAGPEVPGPASAGGLTEYPGTSGSRLPNRTNIERNAALKHYTDSFGAMPAGYGGSQATAEEIEQSIKQSALDVKKKNALGGSGSPFDVEVTGRKMGDKGTTSESSRNYVNAMTVDSKPLTPEQNDEMVRTWGKLAYDPEARRKEYMSRMQKIYRNTLILEALATLTGTPSRAENYNKAMMALLNEEVKFDSEDRMYELNKALYWDQEGNWAPPKTKSEAYHAILKMGGTPEEAQDITEHMPDHVKNKYMEVWKLDDDPDSPTYREIQKIWVPENSAPQGWSKSHAQVSAERDRKYPTMKKSDLPDLGTTGATVDRTLLLEDAIHSMQAGPERQRLIRELLARRASLYGSPLDEFKKQYPELKVDSDGAFENEDALEISGIRGPEGEIPTTYAQAYEYWKAIGNEDKNSLNGTMGWRPIDQGAMSAEAQEANPMTSEEYEKRLRELNPNASEQEIMAAVLDWEMSRG